MKAIAVSARGQITLRKEWLRHLGIHPGDKITIDMLPGGEVSVRAAKPSGKISDAFGMLKREGRKPLSIEDMNEIAAKGWAGSALRH